MKMRLLLDPAVADKPAGGAAPAQGSTPPVAAASVPPKADAAKPATPTQVKTESSATPADASAQAAPWAPPPEKGAEPAKPAAEAGAATDKKEPEKFSLKAPEGSSMDASILDAFGAQMQQLGVNQDQAQKLLEQRYGEQKVAEEAAAAQDRNWLEDLRADKEYGGKNFNENAEATKRAWDFIDPDGAIRREMAKMWVGNYPPLQKGMAKFGKRMMEDKLHTGAVGVPAAKDNRTTMEKAKDHYRAQNEALMAARRGKQ